MKKKYNITFISVFLVHFAALSVPSLPRTFETIAFGKLQFASDKPLELEREASLRDFNISKQREPPKYPSSCITESSNHMISKRLITMKRANYTALS